MNTRPIPETDVWEAYCDECYYHMWRLRRKTERGWYDGFHIHTGEEAKGLCETLNKLERERDKYRDALKTISVSDWKTSGELRQLARLISLENVQSPPTGGKEA